MGVKGRSWGEEISGPCSRRGARRFPRVDPGRGWKTASVPPDSNRSAAMDLGLPVQSRSIVVNEVITIQSNKIWIAAAGRVARAGYEALAENWQVDIG